MRSASGIPKHGKPAAIAPTLMKIPFSTDQFLDIFRIYNEAVWPAPIVAYLLALLAIAAAASRLPWSGQFIGGVLALFWVWIGMVYHITFFSRINPAALFFGFLFIAQGILFLVDGPIRHVLTFQPDSGLRGVVGWLLVLYAMVIYPISGAMLGHGYPDAPVFGIAPCPTAIFTFGLLLWSQPNVSGRLLIIPVIWAVIGSTAALSLGILEDTGLLAASVLTVALWIARRRKNLSVAALT